MATAKRKQEELGEECDDAEPHDTEACSDDDEAKRPRLELHHQHLPHHALPHHRQWSRAPGAADEPAPIQFPRKFDACASDKREVKEPKELDVDSDTNKDSYTAHNPDNDHSVDYYSKGFVNYKDVSRNEKFPFNYSRPSFSNSNMSRPHGDPNLESNVNNSYYFNVNEIYPEYLVPQPFCKEPSSEDAPCDLSNWQLRGLNKFEQSLAETDREMANTSGSVESEHDMLNNSEQNTDDNVQQPINFAYYHF